MQTNILNEQDFYYANKSLGGDFMAKKKSKAVSKKPVKQTKVKKQDGEVVSFVEIKEEMSSVEKSEAYGKNIDLLTKIKNALVSSTPIDEKDAKINSVASRLSLMNEKIIFMAMEKSKLDATMVKSVQ